MPVEAVESKVTHILDEITSLSVAQLDKLLREVVALRLEKRKLVLPKRESELLKTINCSLPPKERQTYRELRQKLRAGTLKESEHVELIRLSDRLEWLGVARLKALVELAAIRKTTLPRLMKQMGIKPAAYASAA